MAISKSDHARECMKLAKTLPLDGPFMAHAGPVTVLAILYGTALNALAEINRCLLEESNAGDELCKDLIYQTLLLDLPQFIHEVLGYDT